jgi:hypothetical protein
MFCTKHSHELALKRIGRYLKQTQDQGMVMNPSTNICKIDVGQNRSTALKQVADRKVGEACIVKRKVTSSLGERGHKHLKGKAQ